jgi:cytochrome c553
MKLILTIALALGFSSAMAKGDIAKGKAKSMMCASCHGMKGISSSPIWPNLAGQKAAYTVKQLKAFKNGTRKDASMKGMTAGLTVADMENLAAYYASLK